MDGAFETGTQKLNQFGRLANKMVEELSDLSQFTDRERRKALMKRGITALKSLLVKRETQEKIETKISNTLERVTEPDGLLKFHANSAVSLFVFPERSKIAYWNQALKLDQLPDTKLIITPTTWKRNNGDVFPEEGFLTGEKGIVIPFPIRKIGDKIQHGGILFHQDTKNISIMPYAILEKLRDNGIGPKDMLMEANWYMDSSSQMEILSRPNLQRPEPYSGIGRLYSEDDSKELFFSFSSQAESMDYSGGDTTLTSISPTLHEVAAFCNVVSRQLNFQKWEVCGLEYNGGLTLPPSFPLDSGNNSQSDHHQIRVSF